MGIAIINSVFSTLTLINLIKKINNISEHANFFNFLGFIFFTIITTYIFMTIYKKKGITLENDLTTRGLKDDD